nr:hypothetical protein [Candidatus Woesearchaeota archaeon]
MLFLIYEIFRHVQRIVVVYGTRDRIKTFLEANIQAIKEDREEKINLREIKNDAHSWFKDLKHFIYKGD